MKFVLLYINKSDLLFHVVKYEIMEKVINKCICFFARTLIYIYHRNHSIK